jgi:hypothetical protein
VPAGRWPGLWRRTVTETDMMGSPSKYRLERNGIRLGACTRPRTEAGAA